MPATSREYHYSRVIVTYSGGETSSNRVFKDRGKAERWAEQQKKSGVVKKATVESFVRKPYDAHTVRIGRKPV